jgi:hypothetical protein
MEMSKKRMQKKKKKKKNNQSFTVSHPIEINNHEQVSFLQMKKIKSLAFSL